MDVNVVVKIKSSYSVWRGFYDNDAENREKVCDDSRTICGQVDDKTAMVNFYDVDMEAMGAMMSSPEFIKLTEDHLVEHIVSVLAPMPQ
tara:strand:+ start:135 stop:401 length:267 start_codon:yes stop_codon:yes gene_type:complete